MRSEGALMAVLVALALLPLLGSALPRRSWTVRVFALAVWLLAALGAGWAAISVRAGAADKTPITDRPVEVTAGGYVSSDKCQSCHPHNYDTWHDSYHRTMTRVASPETVRGRFDGEERLILGRRYTPQRRGNEYWMVFEEQDPAGPPGRLRQVERRIAMITGSHHMQIYWYASGRSRLLGQIPIVWFIREERWITRDSAFLHPPGPLSTTEFGRWNLTCLQCHTTAGRARLDLQQAMARQQMPDADTEVAEFGIACEACHGPSAAHVAANRDPRKRYRHHVTGEADPSVVEPSRLTAHLSSQTCGQCHGISRFYSIPEDYPVWNENGFAYRPGDDLLETRYFVRPAQGPPPPELRRAMRSDPGFLVDRYWSDGMVRVSGREYNGLIESPCYEGGEYSCLSCHRMHQEQDDPRPRREWANDQLEIGMESDEACLQCHDSFRDAIGSHTHHEPESAGSRCYNCHMPHTTYGLLKAMRSHQVDSPTVQASLRTGRPNACNLCHLDRSLGWTAENLERWYGVPQPELTRDEQTIAASLVWLLSGDAGQRALLAWAMGWEPTARAAPGNWRQPFLAQLLDDPYDAVRYIAGRSLARQPGFEQFEYDFLAPPATRQAAKRMALGIWSDLPKSPPVSPSVLVDTEGGLMVDVANGLLQKRNDRPVNLAE